MIFEAYRLTLSLEGKGVLLSIGDRLLEVRDPNIIRPQCRGRVILLLDYHYLVGDRWRFDFSLVGFEPDPTVICGDSQGGDTIKELV